MAVGQTLIALEFLLGSACEIVIVEGCDDEENRAVCEEINRRFMPNAVVLARRSDESDADLVDSVLDARGNAGDDVSRLRQQRLHTNRRRAAHRLVGEDGDSEFRCDRHG